MKFDIKIFLTYKPKPNKDFPTSVLFLAKLKRERLQDALQGQRVDTFCRCLKGLACKHLMGYLTSNLAGYLKGHS